MELVNEVVCVNSKNTDLRVIDVEILQDLCLLLDFSNGEKRIFDASQLLNYPVYEKLKDSNIFQTVSVKNGILIWDDENIDVGTDYLYKNSRSYTQD